MSSNHAETEIDLDTLDQALDLYGPVGPIMLTAFKRDVRALVAELRASRKVVEAAHHIEIHWDSLMNGDLIPAETAALEQALVDAMFDLESLK